MQLRMSHRSNLVKQTGETGSSNLPAAEKKQHASITSGFPGQSVKKTDVKETNKRYVWVSFARLGKEKTTGKFFKWFNFGNGQPVGCEMQREYR